MKRTQAQTIAIIRNMGLSCTFDRDSREFRIAAPIATVQHFHPDMTRNQAIAKAEAGAYYTDCKFDAIGTAEKIKDFWSK